jgi:hypothetical protein
MDMDLVEGYTVYRSNSASGPYTALALTAAQNRNGPVNYTDSSLSQGVYYYYKIAVNVQWGGAGAPEYMTTTAMSAASAPVYLGASPTATQVVDTPTGTPTPQPTGTYTITVTLTWTFTQTVTLTATLTASGTGTNTCSSTPTWTETPVPSLTYTSTGTYTATATATATATFALAANLSAEKLAILNSPLENGRLLAAFYSEEAGTASIYVYNVAGEMVYRDVFDTVAGVNTIDREFKKARGLYLLRAVIKTQSGTVRLPVRKFAVTKNVY